MCGQVRKKNLQPDSLHQVRVRAKMGEQWGDFSDPLAFSTLASDVKRMQPPSVGDALPLCYFYECMSERIS
jgi:hypothetical protein